MLGNLFAPLAMKVSGGIIAALLIALAIVMWRADAISADREKLRNALAMEAASHAVTRQSVATLEGALARFVGAGRAARAAQLAAIEAQAGDSAALQAQADAIRAEMATFNRDGRCATPGSILNAEGL